MKAKNCLICGNEFLKKSYISNKNWAKSKYCSVSCSGKSKKILSTQNCLQCGVSYPKKPSHIKRNKNNFCSVGCHSLFLKNQPFYKQNAYKGVRKIGESKQIYHKNYCKNNKIAISHLKSRRYAREKGAVGSHTLNEWLTLKNLFNNKCAICKEEKPLTKDHIIPLSKEGSDYIENIQPLCKSCNSKKHNKILTPN